MSKYDEIYNNMQVDKWYTASELGVAAASMTAMYNRGMVDRTDTSPRKYKRINNVLSQIIEVLKNYPSTEYFTLYKTNVKLGMMCLLDKSGKILDCWGKTYNLAGVDRIQIGQNILPL